MRDACRLLGVGRDLVLVGGLSALFAAPSPAAGQDSSPCHDLVADARRVVGEVCVSVTAAAVDIVIVARDTHRLLESRVAVAGTLDGFPLSESNVPRLGLFPHAEEHDPPATRASYRISRSELELPAEELLIAVHASVVDELEMERGAWADGIRFRPRGMPATYFVVPILE